MGIATFVSGEVLKAVDLDQTFDAAVTAATAAAKTYTDSKVSPIPVASSSQLGLVKQGPGLNITPDGTLSVSYIYQLKPATTSSLGGVKIGSGLSISPDGTLTAIPYGGSTGTGSSITVPSAQLLGGNGSALVPISLGSNLVLSGGVLSANVTPLAVPVSGLIGGNGAALTSVTLGTGLSLTNGVLSSTVTSYTLPLATNSTPGGVIIGSGLSITNGVISATGGSGGASALSGLTDVVETSPTDGQVLTYEASSQKWKNKAVPTSGGGAAANLSATAHQATGISIAGGKGTIMDVPLYSPATGDANDVWLTSLEFRSADNVGGSFIYTIYAGNPASGGVAVSTPSSQINLTNTVSTFFSANSAYVPAATGSNAVYVRIVNQASSPININLQGYFLEVASSASNLPGYTAPPPYTGPLLATVNVGAGQQFPTPDLGIQALADGGTMNVYDGTYYIPFHVPPTYTNITIKAVNRGKVTFDGRGGAGAGFRLAYGKGFVHMETPGVIDGFHFINCGGADDVGDGEAGVYVENFASLGTCTIQYCKFDGNECGIFGGLWQQTGGNCNIVVQNCDFAQTTGNGVTSDGRSHDFYINCNDLKVYNCNFYGGANTRTYGNCMKSRAKTMTVNGGYVAHNQGRCIDRPDGGTLAVSNLTLTAVAGAVANFIGYANENVGATGWPLNGAYNITFDHCNVIGTRYGDEIWIAPPVTCAFTNTTQSWYQVGNVAPSISTSAAAPVPQGTVTGLAFGPPSGTTLSTTPPAPPASASGW